ncbi:MAG: GNAT family N-acetyltransferase [Bacteroidetes bacterium]|nr:GNAT family N-acetyltransferase [Bacteroidota bacterium]
MILRQAEHNDIPAIIDLFVNTIKSVNSRDYSLLQISTWYSTGKNPELWKKKIASEYFIIAEINQVLVGFASINEDGFLDFMYVHKDYQGKGIARTLLNKLEEKAIAQNNEKIYSYVSITAKPFFLRLGYSISGIKRRVKNDVEFINSVMEKKLK